MSDFNLGTERDWKLVAVLAGLGVLAIAGGVGFGVYELVHHLKWV